MRRLGESGASHESNGLRVIVKIQKSASRRRGPQADFWIGIIFKWAVFNMCCTLGDGKD